MSDTMTPRDRGAPRLTELELLVLGRVARGEDPWAGKTGRTRRESQALGRLHRKGCYIGENGRRIVTDAGRAALEAAARKGDMSKVTPPTAAALVARLRALHEKATRGPFEVHRNDRDSGKFSFQVQSYGNGAVLCNHEEYDSKRARWDADLHAEMRNALPALLDAAEATPPAAAEVADPGAVIKALATLARASHAEEHAEDADLWREMVVEARREYDALRAALAAAERDLATERAALLANTAELVRADELLGEARRERLELAEAYLSSRENVAFDNEMANLARRVTDAAGRQQRADGLFEDVAEAPPSGEVPSLVADPAKYSTEDL